MPSPHPDVNFMRRAIDLAMRGRGRVEPNPMVGCVIVRAGQILGEGSHQQYGGPHAEPNAVATCDGSPAGATAYVTLEPCCHTHKQTPPCVPRLIEAGLGRVVAGTVDPNPAVAGQGLEQLRAAGIIVDRGVLERECRQLAAPFFAGIVERRPYVTLKWAETADGKVAGPGGKPLRISGTRSNREVHELRARCDAILIGIGTAIEDDPMLTVRGVTPLRPLLRVVLDSGLRLPPISKLVRTARETPLQVYCSDYGRQEEKHRLDRLVAADVRVTAVSVRGERLMLGDVLADLHRKRVTHLMVEPGPTLARSFFESGLVDRLWVFRSPQPLGDATAPAAATVPEAYVVTGEIELDGDRLTEYLNPASPAFFAAEPSADFRRIAGTV